MSIFIKRLEKPTVHCSFMQIVLYNYTCKQEPTFANVHCLADLSSVRDKSSTWNEYKELIKSNQQIVSSLLNDKSEKYDTEWSVGDEANKELHAGTELKWTTLIKFSLLDAIKRFTWLWTGSCLFLYFLSHSCMYSTVCPVFFRNF